MIPDMCSLALYFVPAKVTVHGKVVAVTCKMYPSTLPSTHTYIHLHLNFPLVIMLVNHRVLTERNGKFHDISVKIHMQTNVFSFTENVKLEIKPNQRSFMNDLQEICIVVVTLVAIFGRGIIGIIW